MKIIVKSEERTICVPLPTALLYNKTLLRFGIRIARKYAKEYMPDIPPEAVGALCAEIKRIKEIYGSWELVSVDEADGDRVMIVL